MERRFRDGGFDDPGAHYPPQMKTVALASAVVASLALVACAAPSSEEQSEDSVQSISQTDPDLTLPQTSDWTIETPGATKKVRVVAYGDSIFAGYNRSLFSVARRAAPLVAGEYLALTSKVNVEVVRRTESGAVASQVESRIQKEKSYMQDPSTRAVYFEMCGNDYLQARDAFKNQSGTCDFSGLDEALATCSANIASAMKTINASAPAAASKVVMNLYYPGYGADDANADCTDASGAQVHVQNALFPYMAHSNWRACTLAKQNGFGCADAFAEVMGADYDSNGDGKIDSDALRFDPNESEDAYVERITVTLRSTVIDSNKKELTSAKTVGYLQGDDTHPTYYGSTIGSFGGSGAPDFTAAQISGGKNPQWNLFGHERIGHALAKFNPTSL